MQGPSRFPPTSPLGEKLQIIKGKTRSVEDLLCRKDGLSESEGIVQPANNDERLVRLSDLPQWPRQ